MYPNVGQQMPEVKPAREGLNHDLSAMHGTVAALEKTVIELEQMLSPLLCPVAETSADKGVNPPTPPRSPMRDNVAQLTLDIQQVTRRLRNLTRSLEM